MTHTATYTKGLDAKRKEYKDLIRKRLAAGPLPVRQILPEARDGWLSIYLAEMEAAGEVTYKMSWVNGRRDGRWSLK